MKLFIGNLYLLTITLSIIASSLAVQEKAMFKSKLYSTARSESRVESSSENELSLLTTEQLSEYNKIKKPLAPKRIPQNVLFLQSLISKSYKNAKIQFNPRFLEAESLNKKFESMFPEDKREVGVPVNRETISDETTVPINNAWSNSVYSFKFLWWYTTYPASNAIYGQSYWSSKGGHGENDIIVWEAQFNELTRIHGINIIWAYAPKRYAVECSIDGTNFKTLVDWRDAVTGGSQSWWASLIPALKQANKSFPDRITFDNAVFVLKVRILMKGPVNYYFGLYRVDLFVKNWTMVIKNPAQGQCKEDCWVVNTVSPKPGVPIKTADCVGTIGYSENRELFTLLYDSRVVHYNSGLCVISGYDKNVMLEDCNVSEAAKDGRHKYNFFPDGRITPRYAPDECISKPTNTKAIDISGSAIVEASSESADGGHNGSRIVDGNEGSYWASNPGDEVVTVTLYFKQWESMDDLTINWKYKASNFDVNAFTLENGWKMIMRIKDNTLTKNSLKLRRINARAIQIKMSETKEKYIGKPIYGLVTVEISDGGFNLTRAKCDDVQKATREWILDDQFYYFVGNKPPYIQAFNLLSNTYLRLKKLNRLINSDFGLALKSKAKAYQISKLLENTNKSLSDLLKKIKSFKTSSYSKKNLDFESILAKFNQELFFPYFENPEDKKIAPTIKEDDLLPQIGSIISSPGRDCWHIKQLVPSKKSGHYWIKPRCSSKAIRVFCDFSIDGLGTSFLVWHSESTINSTILDVSLKSPKEIQKVCATLGLYPIEINNKDVAERLTQYIEVLGFNLSIPKVIPLGFDWGCPDGKCTLTYKSINAKQTLPISGFLPSPDPIIWNNNKISKYNSIGLGFSDAGKPFYFNLDNVKIMAIVCSTNEHIPPISDPLDAVLQCSDILSGNAKIDGSAGTKIKVNCPAFCLEKSQHQVYGRETYSDNSSICKAGIHSGKIKNEEGGSFIVVIGAKKDYFGSLEKNGVKSIEYKITTNKTFTIEGANDKCPIDYFIDEDADNAGDQAAAPAAEAGSESQSGGDDQSSAKSGSGDSSDASEPKEEPIKTAVPQTEAKVIPFDNNIIGKPASYEPPKPKPTPEDPNKNKNGGINFDFFSFLQENESLDLDSTDLLESNEGENESLNVSSGHLYMNEKSRNMKNSLKALIKNSKQDIAAIKSQAASALDSAKDVFNKALEPKKDESSTAQVTADLASERQGQAANMIGDIQNSLNNYDLKDKITEAKLASSPQSNPAEEKEKEKKNEADSCVISTDVSVKEIVDFRDKDYDNLKIYDNFGLKMKKLIKDYKSEYSFGIYPSKFSNQHFQITFDKLTKIADYLAGFYEKVRAKGKERVINTENTIESLNRIYATYFELKPFKTSYSAKLEDIFDTFSYKMVTDFPGVWKMVNSNLEGRSNAIHQSSLVKSSERIGTIIYPKGRRFYDFIAKVDIMTRSRGAIGIMFRMVDPFNFLAFEISIDGGYKRIIKVINGTPIVINSISDGGISQNNWFKLFIRAEKNKFKIRFGDAKKYSNYSAAPVVFEFEDINFPKGKVGMFTNGNNDFYFDNFEVKPTPCQLNWDSNTDIALLTDTSNIYMETWNLSLLIKYDIYDPETYINGQGKWSFAKGLFGREVVLLQTGLTEDKSDNKEGTKAIIKNVIVKKKAIIDYQFVATEQGAVGCIFKYVDKDNFFVFEMGGGDDVSKRFFQLRKKVEGSFSVIRRFNTNEEISTVPFFGYELQSWYAITIELDGDSIKVSGSLIGQTTQVLIFNEKDNSLVYGRVGFSTSSTKAAFAEIIVRPTPVPFNDKPFPAQLSQASIEEDVLQLDQFKSPANNDGKKDGDNKNDETKPPSDNGNNNNNDGGNLPPNNNKAKEEAKKKPWKVCATTSTPEARDGFCRDNFKLSKVAVLKCTKNFCGTCCSRFVPKGHPVSFHACKKTCTKLTTPSKPADSEKFWQSECIKNTNPDRNIYNYCEKIFENDPFQQQRCKIDTCRLCCATHDQAIPNSSSSLPSQKKCFEACVEKFPPNLKKK